MAFTAPPPGSIAARPTVRKGGVRAADESPKDFGLRMSGRQASPPAAIAPPPPPSRRDNIIAARADGSFAAKRDAFNAGTAQHGRSMDEAGNITGTAPQATGGQLVPGRSAGSMVWKPNTPTATTSAAPAPVPLAAPAAAPPAATPTAAPAAAPAPASIAPPPPPAAKAPASPAPITPAGTGPLRPPATGQTTALMGRLNTSMAPPPPPGASPAPSNPTPTPAPATPTAAPAPAPAASAPPVAQPPARKPGMINDGQGFKPASEVNAGLRAAQDARAAQSIAPPPPPKPSTASTPSPAPGVLNQAAVDAHWTPERRAASRKEEKRLLDEQEASRIASTTPKPKPKTDAEYADEAKWRAQWADIEANQKAREAAEEIMRKKGSPLPQLVEAPGAFNRTRIHHKSTAGPFTVKSSAADIPSIPTLLVGR